MDDRNLALRLTPSLRIGIVLILHTRDVADLEREVRRELACTELARITIKRRGGGACCWQMSGCSASQPRSPDAGLVSRGRCGVGRSPAAALRPGAASRRGIATGDVGPAAEHVGLDWAAVHGGGTVTSEASVGGRNCTGSARMGVQRAQLASLRVVGVVVSSARSALGTGAPAGPAPQLRPSRNAGRRTTGGRSWA